MRRVRPFRTAVTAVASLVGAAAVLFSASAEAAPFRLDRVEKPPVIDGLPTEWPRELVRLGAVRGTPAPADLSARAAVTYDDKHLYVAVDVTDDVLSGGGDRVDLSIVVGDTTQTVSLFPGQPGKSPAKVTVSGRPVAGARAVEAPGKSGWTLEAMIPWSAFPALASQRVGLTGSIVVQDVDRAGAIEAAVGSADPASPGAFLTSPEQALTDGLVRDKRLGAPSHTLVANVVGDAQKERVLVYDRYLVVLGPTFRGGKEYYWNDMAVAGKALTVTFLDARDLDGDGRAELIMKKRLAPATGPKGPYRDHLEILSFGTADVPSPTLRVETAVGTAKGSVGNAVKISLAGTKGVVTIGPATATGVDEAGYAEAVETSMDPAPLPWGRVVSRTYQVDKTLFKLKEEATRAVAAPAQQPRPAQPATPAPTAKPAAPAAPDASKVYAQYKRDRGVTAGASFTVSADVDGDRTAEKIAVHDRDIVVWGPAFQAGKGYAFTTLGFASAADVKNLTAKDVTGDGKAELLVRGILRQRAGQDEVLREVELVFSVSSQGIRRIFGAEVGRSIGTKRITSTITHDGKGGITLAAGSAQGFSKESYPFGQDTAPVGGLEPLLLPWGGVGPLRYRFQRGAFERL